MDDADETEQVQGAAAGQAGAAARILELVSDAYLTMDREFRILFVNPAAERLLGVSRATLVGRTHWEAFPASRGAEPERRYRRVVAERVEAHFTHHYVGEGYDVYLEIDAYPTDEGGVAVFWRDVSARVRTEEALARQSALTRLVADNATSALFMMDAHGHPTYMNPAATAMTGFTLDEIAGLPLHYVVHHHRPDGSLYPMAECPIDRALPENFDVRAHEDVFLRRDGSFFPVVCAASPILENGVPVGTVVEVRDVTREKAAEAALRTLNAELEAGNARLQEQGLELELANQQLQDQTIELETAVEELQSTAAALEERTREAERARQESQAARQRLIETFESITDPFFTVDREWRFTYINPAAERVVGRARSALLGKVLWEEFPEAVGTAYHENAMRAIRERRAVDFEAYYPPPLDLWTAMRIYPLGGAREPDGAAVYYQDVTARKRAEMALAASERQWRTMADAIPTLAWTARADGYIDWYNARWYEYTGTSPEQMAGWGWQAVHDPAVLPDVLARWQASIATGKPFEMTFPLRGADGRFRSFLTRVSPVVEGGQVVRWFGTNTDVDVERAGREAAERAAERTERLQALTAALAGARTIDDVATVVVAEVVAATGALTGMLATRKPDAAELEVVRQTGFAADMMVRYARFPLAAATPAAECVRTGEPVWAERRDGPDGLLARFPFLAEVWERLGVSAVAAVPLAVAGEVVGAMSFTFDAPRAFTPEDRAFFLALGRQGAQAFERARLFEAERAARAAAEGANQAKTDFLAVMSHELRTPLNAIAGYAELIELGIHGPVTEAQREAISRIRRSQRHLLGLINDVLNFAKLEAGYVEYHLSDVRVRDAVDALEPLVAPQLRAKQLRFDRAACADGRVVRADPDKLQQVLVNLLTNAIKFTPAGGAVTLRCEDRGAAVAIVVQDTGIGIAADRLEQVFAPFVQIDRRLNAPHEGTGLGLAISRDLARGMGGDLTVASEPGVGSRFMLTLPRA